MAAPQFIYKIATASQIAATHADFAVMAIDRKDGFMHLSTAAQLPQTLALHFSGQSGLALLAVRSSDVAANLRWEPSRGGQLFPHLYGPLPRAAIAAEAIVDVAPDGAVLLPDWVR